MDSGQFEIPQNQSNPHLGKFKKLLLFTEIGLFEVGFVTLILFIIFGSLVFFHVIALNKIPFANTLPSLFHQKSSTSSISVPKTPIDAANIYIEQNLTQKYQPSQKNYTANSATNPTLYNLIWDNSSFSGRMRIKINYPTQNVDKYLLTGTIDKPKGVTALTPDIAAKLFKTYFITPNTIAWRCDFASDIPANTTMCFTAYKKDNLFIGYEVISPNDQAQIVLISCQSTNFLEASIATGCRKMQ